MLPTTKNIPAFVPVRNAWPSTCSVTPVYCGWWSTNEDLKCNIILRSNEVDLTKYTDTHVLADMIV